VGGGNVAVSEDHERVLDGNALSSNLREISLSTVMPIYDLFLQHDTILNWNEVAMGLGDNFNEYFLQQIKHLASIKVSEICYHRILLPA